MLHLVFHSLCRQVSSNSFRRSSNFFLISQKRWKQRAADNNLADVHFDEQRQKHESQVLAELNRPDLPPPITIPRERIDVQFSRSSGAGGQNVNKVNTKAEIRFEVDSADWIPHHIRDQFKKLHQNRINKSGELVIASSVTRSQHLNIEDAYSRLTILLREAQLREYEESNSQRKSPDDFNKPSKVSMISRIHEKKAQSQKKSDRRSKGEDY